MCNSWYCRISPRGFRRAWVLHREGTGEHFQTVVLSSSSVTVNFLPASHEFISSVAVKCVSGVVSISCRLKCTTADISCLQHLSLNQTKEIPYIQYSIGPPLIYIWYDKVYLCKTLNPKLPPTHPSRCECVHRIKCCANKVFLVNKNSFF